MWSTGLIGSTTGYGAADISSCDNGRKNERHKKIDRIGQQEGKPFEEGIITVLSAGEHRQFDMQLTSIHSRSNTAQ